MPAPSSEPSAHRFATTAWSIVVRASGSDPAARPALEDLSRAYWYPLYAYHRRRGAAAAEAEDAVQSFFAHLLEKNIVRYADPNRGRFRGFLVTAFRQFLAKRNEYESAGKRRPAGIMFSIDAVAGEARYSAELSDTETPDRLFEYTWAVATLDRAMTRLRGEQETEGKADRFRALQGTLTGQATATHAELAAGLGMSEGAIRVQIHRLRQRFAQFVREEVAATLGEGESVDEELRTLLTALRSGGPA
ncbi:MAG: hypothetical protein U0798_02510 [Gemmataceae bacterium]